MEPRQGSSTETRLFEECINPGVQEKVFKYLLDDIEAEQGAELEAEQEAEAVEDHLLECRYCRETFLTMLSIRVEADGANNLRGGRGEPAPADAQLLTLADAEEQGAEETRPALRAKSARGQSK